LRGRTTALAGMFRGGNQEVGNPMENISYTQKSGGPGNGEKRESHFLGEFCLGRNDLPGGKEMFRTQSDGNADRKHRRFREKIEPGAGACRTEKQKNEKMGEVSSEIFSLSKKGGIQRKNDGGRGSKDRQQEKRKGGVHGRYTIDTKSSSRRGLYAGRKRNLEIARGVPRKTTTINSSAQKRKNFSTMRTRRGQGKRVKDEGSVPITGSPTKGPWKPEKKRGNKKKKKGIH